MQRNHILKRIPGNHEILREAPLRTDGGISGPTLGPVYSPKPATMTRNEMIKILTNQWGTICWGCGFEPPIIEYLELDHIQPQSENGSHELENRAPLCSPCNKRKSDTMTLTGLREKNQREKRIINPQHLERIKIKITTPWAEKYSRDQPKQGSFITSL